ncbi:aminotransferase [Enterobacter asburiae]|uniref:aminotransferase n=1 Tax=Enterobacter asburiae TaxID=61645 RepID=UPI002004915F|nr:aminotransferase [Enterobacter asburiae]MCK7247719.1 aminotransferase [Enterobacter asburiae]MEB8258212.1 aminotransferase [Enterobacter asburiae]HCR2161332.1 aminotransferase [Enterobacter asburiae]
MKIRPFGVEQWMNEWETRCEYNLAETCVESLTMQQLLDMTGKTREVLEDMLNIKMTYGHITGSERLRQLISEQYSKQSSENILITHGAIGANALIYETLVEPGDTVISVLPTYQQHYSIPASYGADVKILPLREENGFLPDLAELKSLIDDKTKLIAINNPNNPTGALIGEALLHDIVEVARSAGAWLLCDEVYRGTDQDGDGYTTAMADLYEKGISTASMSKAYSLAGLRLGWIAGPVELLKEVEIHRDYNTVSVGILDDYFATLALENRDKILARNQKMLRDNLKTLDEWVSTEPLVSYVKPRAGTTALLKYELPLSSREFCVRLLERYGVMFTPGEALDMEGYLRIGFANNSEVMKQGLTLVSRFIRELAEENR